jgi:hypothetical protein
MKRMLRHIREKVLQWWLLLLLLEMFLYGRIKSMIRDEMMVCQR